MKRKVNLFIVGAAKAGTTALFETLNKSENISGLKIKEPNYFADIKTDSYSKLFFKKINKEEEYEKLIIDDNAKYIMDGSTSYLWSKNAAKRIYAYNQNAKIISHYLCYNVNHLF